MSLLTVLVVVAVAASQKLLPPTSGRTGPVSVPNLNTTGFENATTRHARGGLAVCVSGTVPVTASGTNVKFDFDPPTNQTQLTQIFVDLVTAGSPLAQQITAGTHQVGGTYDIGAELCMPPGGHASSTVQFLTHGVDFDRYYWDFAPQYSYVDYAAARGVTTFFYDRLGVGTSSKADPIQEVQSSLQVGIAVELVKKLRAGALGGVTASKVVGVGHSFGSIITQAITAEQPALFDAAVLTGFTTNSSGFPSFVTSLGMVFASRHQPHRFGDLGHGYVVPLSVQPAFFHFPGFDSRVLKAAEMQIGSSTLGEFFTTTAVTKVATNFTGPVTIVNGLEDLPFCSGNCSYPTDLGKAVLPVLYPNVPDVTNSTYLAPDTGHGINMHYNAAKTFAFIQDFLKGSGL